VVKIVTSALSALKSGAAAFLSHWTVVWQVSFRG